MSRARIIATLGPASSDESTIEQMIEAGVNVFRLNYSHGSPDEKTELYRRIRRAEDAAGRPIGILADAPGPKIRLGTFDGPVQLKEGMEVGLECGRMEGHETEPVRLPAEWDGLSADLAEGDPILLADGLIELKVVEAPKAAGATVRTVVVQGGPITSRKGVNVPQTLVRLPSVGPKDRAVIEHALEHEADFIALSYVRQPEDIAPARAMIEAAGRDTWIVSKIEHPTALKHLDRIASDSDVIMVARGDLGVEMPLEEVPHIQANIIETCQRLGRPVIVATQMLESMIEHSRPTRAEVSDVAGAIQQGSHAVMLSGESAVGAHPVDAVSTMRRIAEAAQRTWNGRSIPPDGAAFSTTRSLAGATVRIAEAISADGLLVATETGSAARLVGAYRPSIPILAMTTRRRSLRRMTLLPGVEGVLVEEESRARTTIAGAARRLAEQDRLNGGGVFVTLSGSPMAITGRSNTIRVLEFGEDGTLAEPWT